jgi:hypothetical protein
MNIITYDGHHGHLLLLAWVVGYTDAWAVLYASAAAGVGGWLCSCLSGVSHAAIAGGVVWCGVVWCGVVWCGVVWCGAVWCGVVWFGVVWCGLVWCGVVWWSVVWCGVVVCAQLPEQCVSCCCWCG